MKFGVDAPWYDDPVERVAFNGYAMEQSLLEDLADYINENDESDLSAACMAVGCPLDLANRNIEFLLRKTGREANYD